MSYSTKCVSLSKYVVGIHERASTNHQELLSVNEAPQVLANPVTIVLSGCIDKCDEQSASTQHHLKMRFQQVLSDLPYVQPQCGCSNSAGESASTNVLPWYFSKRPAKSASTSASVATLL